METKTFPILILYQSLSPQLHLKPDKLEKEGGRRETKKMEI
jgi:hypothetical protein